jgi:hypothetical protein
MGRLGMLMLRQYLRVETIFLACGIVVFLANRPVLADDNVLSADLAFHFLCDGVPPLEVERKVERFLADEKFNVLNRAKIQREKGDSILNVDIVALDDKHRIITIFALPRTDKRYAVTLNTRPPTQRSSKLEDALINFASNNIKCEIRQISKNENEIGAQAFHDEEVARIERLLEQAERIQGKQRL